MISSEIEEKIYIKAW